MTHIPKLRDDGEVFTCHLCDKDFDSAKALSMHQAKSALHARLLAEDSSGLREPSSSKRQTLPKAEAEVPASHEGIDFVIPAAEKNNPTSLDAGAQARKGSSKKSIQTLGTKAWNLFVSEQVSIHTVRRLHAPPPPSMPCL